MLYLVIIIGWLFDEDGNIIIDEPEYLEIQKVLNLKAVYRTAMEELNSLKPEIQYCERQVELSRQRMVQGQSPISSIVIAIENFYSAT